MKKLKKLSLHNLSQAEMTKKEMNVLTGGAGGCNCNCNCNCNCGCNYAGSQDGPNDSYYGGSSTNDNQRANSQRSGDGFSYSSFESNDRTNHGGYYA